MVYANTLKVSELTRLEKVHYQAAKIVTGTLHFSSKDKLNVELGWKSIKNRIDFLGLYLFQKMCHLTRPLVRRCMPKVDWNNDTRTRCKTKFLNSIFLIKDPRLRHLSIFQAIYFSHI